IALKRLFADNGVGCNLMSRCGLNPKPSSGVWPDDFLLKRRWTMNVKRRIVMVDRKDCILLGNVV
ncbi:MAG: hypothetical protein KAR47_14365, partial [Planctomycetes bacterium]|nr:hypothetical protein [Planctomycetota bacterium]